MANERSQAESAADQPTLPTPPSGSGTDPKTATLQSEAAERIGGTIGPYKLLDELGEGGMGTVYLAEQERPVRRRVALKVIKPGLDTAQVIARFEAERQALALMDHPNIARVVDAGATTSGRPFFVMELVQGAPITNYCDAHRVPLRERLALYLPICRAVQHAHQKGIIHRDLKPSNILVTIRDDQPVPKIIDFGIAKATTQRLTERTLYTQHGHLVGTPDYMSPEQAGLGGLDVDTRSDVYSLGAMLYELLCGETPLGHRQLRQLDFVTMLNTIYEAEPPPPSRRLSELGEKITDVARRRDIEPHRLTQSLHGELDWIVTKALEKERTRRYESASALAADIERYLNNQPVEASPPSATYRVRKFVRRNRLALSAAAAIAVVLLVATGVSMWQAYRATQAESEMAVERQVALQAKGRAERLLADVQASKKLAESRRVEAENAKKLADERGTQLAVALAKANESAGSERQARGEIERRLREADAMRLAMNSKDSRQRYPQRALLLAAEALETTRRKNEPIRSAAHQALREALDNIGGRPLTAHQGPVHFLEVTPNGRWIVTSDMPSVRRWDLATENPADASVLVGPPSLNHRAAAVSPDGRLLATLSSANNARKFHLWELQTEKLDQPLREFELATQDYMSEVKFTAGSRWLVAGSYQTAWLWDLAPEATNGKPIILSSKNLQISDVDISANGQWAVSRDSSRVATLWNLAGRDGNPTPRRLTAEGMSARSILSPDGRWLFASDRSSRANSSTKVWDLNAADPFQSPRQVPLDTRQIKGDVLGHFLPQGRLLAIASGDSISIWDLSAETWQAPKLSLSLRDSPNQDERAVPGNIDLGVQTVISDRDGRWLFAVDQNGTISRWDLQAANPQASRFIVGRHPGGSGVELAISGSGRWLVSTRTEDPPRLWDLWGRNPRTTGMELLGHDTAPYGAVQVALGGGKLSAYAASTQPFRGLPFLGLGGRVGASLGLGERWLVTRGADATLRIWDLAAEDPARAGVRAGRLKLDGGGNDVAVRDDGRWIIGSGINLQIVNPDAAVPGEGSIVIRPGTFGISWSSRDRPLSRDGRWLALRTGDRISIFDLTSEELLGESKAAADTSSAQKGQSDQASSVWQPAVAGGRWLQQFAFPKFDRNRLTAPGAHPPSKVVEGESQANVQEIMISPDGHWLLTQSAMQVRLWRLRGPDFAARAVAAVDLGQDLRHTSFSLDGRWLVSLRRMESRTWLSLWNLAADPPHRSQHDMGQGYVGDGAHAISGDGRWMAAAAGRMLLWSIADDGTFGQPQVLNSDVRNLQCVAISHDGQFIAASENQVLNLWRRGAQDSAAGHLLLHGHEQPIDNVAFSPDGTWLVAASHDGEIRLWDLREEQLQDTMITLAVDRSSQRYFGLQRFVFSPDGRWLAAGTYHGVYFWQLDPVPLLDEARRIAGRELTTDELARYRLNSPDVQRERLLREAAAVARRIEKDPQNIALRRLRADLLACAGQLQEAIDEMRLVIRLNPQDHWPQYNLLPLLAQSGQSEAYRRACESMAEQFAKESERLEIHERVAKGSLFWAESGADWTKVAPLADRGLKESTAKKHWAFPWAAVTKGLAEYRLGNYAAALEWAEKSFVGQEQVNSYGKVAGHQIRAMALVRLGKIEDAQAALAAAKRIHAAWPKPLDRWVDGWHDWYMAEIMFREAEAVLLAKSPPATDLAPKAQP